MIWRQYIKMLKSVQKFLSIKQIRIWVRRGFISLIKWSVRTILRFLGYLWRTPSAAVVFGVSAIVPVVGVWIFCVALPVVSLKDGFLHSFIKTQTTVVNSEKNNSSVSLLPKNWPPQAMGEKLEELYLRSQLQLARSDSITLALDLRSSAMQLVIKGVCVRTCSLVEVNTSKDFIFLYKNGLLIDWLGSPFVLKKEWASMPKVPIKVKMAPADTNAAASQVTEPHPELPVAGYLTLDFDRNLQIIIEQAQPPTFGDFFKRQNYYFLRSLATIGEQLWALIHFKIPQHKLQIRLTLKKEDIKALYRAIPKNAGMAILWGE